MSEKAKHSLHDRVLGVLDLLRPALRLDGGDIELVDIDDDGVVRVRLLGACIGCPSSAMTLTLGIERNLRDRIPEVARVICV
ncbi:MAG: NifU family protein [Phycisphaerae bacterium]